MLSGNPRVTKSIIDVSLIESVLNVLYTNPLFESASKHLIWKIYNLFNTDPELIWTYTHRELYTDRTFNLDTTVRGLSQNEKCCDQKRMTRYRHGSI